jgi:uncharacterized membrane protein
MHASMAFFWLFNLGVVFCWPLLQGSFLRDKMGPLYAASCHQIVSRCYHIGGEPMPICARCLGLWIGFAAVAAIAATVAGRLPFWRTSVGLGLMAVILVDWLLGFAVMPAHWRWERTLTGVLGAVGAYIVTVQALNSISRYSISIKERMARRNLSWSLRQE